MNLKDIEALIKFVQKTGVSEVSIEQKDLKITIKTHAAQQQVIQASLPAMQAAAQSALAAPAPYTSPVAAAAPVPAEAPKPKGADDSKYITIKSPMIGTFYRSSSPDKPVFVNVGDEIKQGKVLCIIEAMKLFNEIESEVSGKIVKVLADNSTPVEYDQPLFLVDPS
jgi:acetyl-CoA carboxylase biotin carboxyl carrier protein